MNNKRFILSALIIFLLVGLAVGGYIIWNNSPAQRLKRFISLGERYMSATKYEEAILEFQKAIDIDPDNEASIKGITDAYINWSKDYSDARDYEKALEILRDGYNNTGYLEIEKKLKEVEKEYEQYLYEIEGLEAVIWSDPTFEKMIRSLIGKESGEVKVRDLDYITKLSVYGDKYIFINEKEEMYHRIGPNIDGENSDFILEFYYSEEKEAIHGITEIGTIKDVSALKYFRNLENVLIIANQITDVSVLDSMPKLKEADFWANKISDTSPLEKFCLSGKKYQMEQNVSIGDRLRNYANS